MRSAYGAEARTTVTSPVSSKLTSETEPVVTLDSFPALGITLAAVAAAILAVGNMLQARGVRAQDSTVLGFAQVRALFRNVPWLLGTVLLGIAIVVQLASLTFAPLIVVQPVGVAALVFASMLSAWQAHTWPSRREVRAIATSVIGVAAFVTVAAIVSTQSAITDAQLIAVLIALAVVLVVALVLTVVRRGQSVPPVLLVIVGGVFSGFVATLGKTVILRVQTTLTDQDFSVDASNTLTLACVLGIALSGGLSIYLVQSAHTVNSPQVVVAGLTVIDPFVAVILGITILHEAAGAPLWAIPAFVVAGAVAIWGVFDLARVPDPSGASGPAAPARHGRGRSQS